MQIKYKPDVRFGKRKQSCLPHMSLDGTNWVLTRRWNQKIELSQEEMDNNLLQHGKEVY